MVDRQTRATLLLDCERTMTGDDGAEDGTAAADVVADLLHLLGKRAGLRALRLALAHVEAETGRTWGGVA